MMGSLPGASTADAGHASSGLALGACLPPLSLTPLPPSPYLLPLVGSDPLAILDEQKS